MLVITFFICKNTLIGGYLMAKYQIFTDSSSDLTPELRKQHNLEYFYFGLVVDGVEYRADLDWKDYSVEEFREFVESRL